MTETLTHFIGGKQISAPGALESINPSNTKEIIARFPDGKAGRRQQGRRSRPQRPSRLGPVPASRKCAPTCWTRPAP